MNPAFNYVLNRPCPRVCRAFMPRPRRWTRRIRDITSRTPVIMRIRKRKKVASTNETWLVRAYLRSENVYKPPTTSNLTCDAPFLCSDFPFPTCTPCTVTCIGYTLLAGRRVFPTSIRGEENERGNDKLFRCIRATLFEDSSSRKD